MGIYSHFTEEQRISSYDYIEDFISKNVTDWSKWNKEIGTDDIEQSFSASIHAMTDIDFEFLLLHSGYLPDYYEMDSSQETLYTKLVESMVCEWAKRVGFTESILQKQKSSKEDITIKKDGRVIVCDAKSFRLGRSQAAPNVKDTIKKEAYSKWLKAYPEDKRIGGLTTFPSLHNWKKGGDTYAYYTEGSPSIMILFYEQMSFILHKGIRADSIIHCLESYDSIFPKSSKDQSVYWKGIESHLFKNTDDDNTYADYMQEVRPYIVEKVNHSLCVIRGMIAQIEKDVDELLSKTPIEELQKIAREALVENRRRKLKGQENNIQKFRPTSLETQGETSEETLF